MITGFLGSPSEMIVPSVWVVRRYDLPCIRSPFLPGWKRNVQRLRFRRGLLDRGALTFTQFKPECNPQGRRRCPRRSDIPSGPAHIIAHSMGDLDSLEFGRTNWGYPGVVKVAP